MRMTFLKMRIRFVHSKCYVTISYRCYGITFALKMDLYYFSCRMMKTRFNGAQEYEIGPDYKNRR